LYGHEGRNSAGRLARRHSRSGRGRVYQKPKVERYGTFRELTQVGFNGTSDGYTVSGIGNETCSSITAPGCRTGS